MRMGSVCEHSNTPLDKRVPVLLGAVHPVTADSSSLLLSSKYACADMQLPCHCPCASCLRPSIPAAVAVLTCAGHLGPYHAAHLIRGDPGLPRQLKLLLLSRLLPLSSSSGSRWLLGGGSSSTLCCSGWLLGSSCSSGLASLGGCCVAVGSRWLLGSSCRLCCWLAGGQHLVVIRIKVVIGLVNLLFALGCCCSLSTTVTAAPLLWFLLSCWALCVLQENRGPSRPTPPSEHM